MLDTEVFESLLRDGAFERSMMYNHQLSFHQGVGVMCPVGPRSVEMQGKLCCREQRIWGSEVCMNYIRASGSLVSQQGSTSSAPCSWPGKNGSRILGKIGFL